MRAEPRLLRALVIHDSGFSEEDAPNILGTKDLELYAFSLHDGRTIQRIRQWTDVLRVLNSLVGTSSLETSSPDPPDLLLIDSDFEKDINSPRFLRAEKQDPRGLLYGAVFAAYFQGHRGWRAFAFAPYSQRMHEVSFSPWAQTFYSILNAMHSPLPQEIEAAHFSDSMAAYSGGRQPSEAVGEALSRYREHLIESFANYLDPDYGTFEKTLASFQGSLQKGKSPDRKLAVAWRDARGWATHVFLCSLFADLRPGKSWGEPWSEEEAAPIFELFDTVIEGRSHLREILRPVQEILDKLEQTESVDWATGRRHESFVIKQRRVLAMTLKWAEKRCECTYNRRPMPKRVAIYYESLGLEAIQINRALGQVLPTHERRFKASRYIDMLSKADQWPFDSPAYLPGLVAAHLRDGFESGRKELDPEYWPPCLLHFACKE